MAFYAQKDPRTRRFDVEPKKEEEKPKAILEDYLLDDEIPSKPKGPKTPPHPAPGAVPPAQSSWQPATTVAPVDPTKAPPTTQPIPTAGSYPPGYPPNYQPPGQQYPYGGYYNQYDYSQQQTQQQQYPGYNYYPGYGPPPGWGAPPVGLPPTAVPPPTMPDLSKPPPIVSTQPPVHRPASPPREERDKGRERERVVERPRERGRERSRERGRERERSRDRDRSRERSRERIRSRERSREKDQSRERERGRERNRREQPHSRGRERSREHSPDRPKERSRDSSRERSAEAQREKQRLKDKKRDESAENLRKLAESVAVQKDKYVKQFEILKRELQILKEQQRDLMQENAKDSVHILEENVKLQDEVKKKLQSISELVRKLDIVLVADKKRRKKGSRSRSHSKERKKPVKPVSNEASSDDDSGSKSEKAKELERQKPKFNLKFFDPEEYWCRVCNIFPDNAKEYLHHLHSQEHKQAMAEINLIEASWHDHNPEKPRPELDGAPERRVPIRGLQFLIAATAWYCKLCHKWMGDLHCTSLHLKSDQHINNVEMYFEDDPEWETTWRKDREKALKQAMQDAKLKKSKPNEPEDVSTSSKFTPRSENSYQDKIAGSPKLDEENAKSIRVAMRNQPKGGLAPMGPAIPPNHPLSHPVSKLSTFWGNTAKKEAEKREAEKSRLEEKKKRGRSSSADSLEARRRSRGHRSRSRSHDKRRDRRSRSRDRRRRRSRSGSTPPPQRRELKKWVEIPSSPPPYIVRKTEEKDKIDKMKKKPAPVVAKELPKSKFGFIGKMPVLKAKKKAETEAQQANVSGDPFEYYAYNAYMASTQSEEPAAAEESTCVDMEVDNGDDSITNGSEATPKVDLKKIEEMDEMALLGIDPEDIMAQIM